jgi:hypothetical protein
VAALAEAEACELAALAEAVVSAEVDCEPATLVAVACVRLVLTEVGLQEIASRMPVPLRVFRILSVELVGPATGPAGVGAVVAGADVGPAIAGAGAEIIGADVGPAIAGAGAEIIGAGVGAQQR